MGTNLKHFQGEEYELKEVNFTLTVILIKVGYWQNTVPAHCFWKLLYTRLQYK